MRLLLVALTLPLVLLLACEDCRSSHFCREEGKCGTASGGKCLSPDEMGACLTNDVAGMCLVADDDQLTPECQAFADRARAARVVRMDGKCVAIADEDCGRSDACRYEGRCVARNFACVKGQ